MVFRKNEKKYKNALFCVSRNVSTNLTPSSFRNDTAWSQMYERKGPILCWKESIIEKKYRHVHGEYGDPKIAAFWNSFSKPAERIYVMQMTSDR